MKLEARMSKLEAVVEQHLEQSGYIQTDLSWLKKAFWVLAGGMVTFSVTFMVGLLLFLLHK